MNTSAARVHTVYVPTNIIGGGGHVLELGQVLKGARRHAGDPIIVEMNGPVRKPTMCQTKDIIQICVFEFEQHRHVRRQS